LAAAIHPMFSEQKEVWKKTSLLRPLSSPYYSWEYHWQIFYFTFNKLLSKNDRLIAINFLNFKFTAPACAFTATKIIDNRLINKLTIFQLQKLCVIHKKIPGKNSISKISSEGKIGARPNTEIKPAR